MILSAQQVIRLNRPIAGQCAAYTHAAVPHDKEYLVGKALDPRKPVLGYDKYCPFHATVCWYRNDRHGLSATASDSFGEEAMSEKQKSFANRLKPPQLWIRKHPSILYMTNQSAAWFQSAGLPKLAIDKVCAYIYPVAVPTPSCALS